jgi:peptide/nickel transport system ATP-binding protein
VQSLRTELQASILFISHNLGLVAQLCDRIGVLYAGRIVEEGEYRQVLGNPQHPYTAGLVNCVPRMGASKDGMRLMPIPGSLPPMGQRPTGCTFGPRCPSADDHCRAAEPELAIHRGRSVRCYHPGSVASEGARLGEARPYRPQPGLLEVRNVTKRYGEVLACEDVTMHIGYREIVGLVGESGSGKTTLGRMIVGLTGADAGDISFEGSLLAPDVAKRHRKVRRRLQMVFQSPDSTLNPTHRVAKVLKRSILKLGGDWDVDDLAARVRLEQAELQRPAARLSGGQKQRAAIARAFAGKPALVVCDEPVSALDVSVQAAVLELLADLQHDTSVSYLFISHDLAVVRYLADRILVMYLGQIVEEGPAASVFNAPHHPYTEMLVASIPSIDARRKRPVAIERDPSPSGCRFQARCAHALDDVCDRVAPPWQELATGHRIRCHLDRETLVEVQQRNPAIRLAD